MNTKYQEGLDNNQIRALRKKFELRQVDVADILGFEVIDRICHWERGRAQPGLINVIRLCKLYCDNSAYTCSKCKTRIPVDDLDEIYKDQLKKFLLTDTSVSDYLKTINVELQERQNLLFAVKEERQKLKKESEAMVKMRINGEWSKETFIEHFRPIEERMKQIDDQLPEIEVETDFLKMQHVNGDTVLYDARQLYNSWNDYTFEQKRHIVEVITREITVGKEDIRIHLSHMPTTAQTAEPAQSKVIQNPVKGQPVHFFALPFSTIENRIPRKAKAYPRIPQTFGEHIKSQA